MKVHFLTHKQLNSEELQAKLLKDLQVAVGSNPIIRVHFEDPEFNPIHAEEKGDWIDLCAGETVSIDGGQSKLISLGVAMKLPNGFEAHLLPRSSTSTNTVFLWPTPWASWTIPIVVLKIIGNSMPTPPMM